MVKYIQRVFLASLSISEGSGPKRNLFGMTLCFSAFTGSAIYPPRFYSTPPSLRPGGVQGELRAYLSGARSGDFFSGSFTSTAR